MEEKVRNLEAKIFQLERKLNSTINILEELVYFFVKHNFNYNIEHLYNYDYNFHTGLVFYDTIEKATQAFENAKEHFKMTKKLYESKGEHEKAERMKFDEAVIFQKHLTNISNWVMPVYRNLREIRIRESQRIKEALEGQEKELDLRKIDANKLKEDIEIRESLLEKLKADLKKIKDDFKRKDFR